MTKKKYPMGTKVMEAPWSTCDLEEPLVGEVIGVAAGFRVIRVITQPSYYDPHVTLAFRVKELMTITPMIRETLNAFLKYHNRLKEDYEAGEKAAKELGKELQLAVRNIQREES